MVLAHFIVSRTITFRCAIPVVFNRIDTIQYNTIQLIQLVVFWLPVIYRVIQNDCWGFKNLSYTIHLRE